MPTQDQRSLLEQLETLIQLANKNGLYDAADFLLNFTQKTREKERSASVNEHVLGIIP